jgi:hypothetical protein
MQAHQTVGWRRALGKARRNALFSLPDNLRDRLIRRSVRLEESPSITCGIARTRAELEAAFSLLHDAYVEAGFMEKHPSGMRILPQNALPSSTVLVVKEGALVVGTLLVIRNVDFGLPIQSLVSAAELSPVPSQVVEFSSLAIRQEFQQRGGRYLFPLLRFAYNFLASAHASPQVLIAVNPKHWNFYRALFGFEQLLPHTIERYELANGAPAVIGRVCLDAAYAKQRMAYKGAPSHRNVFEYFSRRRASPRPYFDREEPVLTPELFEHFFVRKSDLLRELQPRQLAYLRSAYGFDARFRALLGRCGAPGRKLPRKEPRFLVDCAGFVDCGPGGPRNAHIVSASRHGLTARLGLDSVGAGARYRAALQVGPGKTAHLSGKIVRVDARGNYGLSVEAADPVWRAFLSYLLRKRAAKRQRVPCPFSGGIVK